jgi:hypothetical protein
MAENTEEGFYNISDLDESFNEARSKNDYNINKSIKFVYEWYFVNLNSGI